MFVPAADPLFCSAKKVGQKRRPLRWRSALRTDCTRRQGLKREATETRYAQTADASLSVSVPGDASPSNGDPRQRPLQLQLQLQLSLRGQWQMSLREKAIGRRGACLKPLSGRTLVTAGMFIVLRLKGDYRAGFVQAGRCCDPVGVSSTACVSKLPFMP